jgi:hypothetical protein
VSDCQDAILMGTPRLVGFRLLPVNQVKRDQVAAAHMKSGPDRKGISSRMTCLLVGVGRWRRLEAETGAGR